MMNRLAARVTSYPVIKSTRIPIELILRRPGASDSERPTLVDYLPQPIQDTRTAYLKRGSMRDLSPLSPQHRSGRGEDCEDGRCTPKLA
jgi:hypothetical protein